MRASLKFLLVQFAWLIAAVVALYAIKAVGDRLLPRAQAGQGLRAVLFINGTLGDKSFFDGAAKGMRDAARALPVSVRIIEGGTDPTRWLPALTSLVDSGDYDLIVTGTFTMAPYVEQLARDYPDRRFVLYDASVDTRRCACRNVQSLLFRQNEGAYLAGYLAAKLDQAGLPGMPPGGGLGVMGGMQFPVVDDFIVGFRAGAKAADPSLPVATQYANSFSDPALGKEIAKTMYGRGAGIVFHVAGASGQGVNEAALETGRYAIGVDVDQYAIYQRHQPALAARIVTSVIKNVDVAVLEAIRRAARSAREGNAPTTGGILSLGLAERGVSLAPRAGALENAPPALLLELDQVQAEIITGQRRVPSAFAAKTS
ncbi:BMP family ABC transporter substrate-binding protein [Roseateles sp. SL47]|uniref:BMP family lipoprotein n=1 Tax=Roseateles sp. SL47 TaxID=2995138 RepID=UPI0022702945|nr:BMP family ABC transporter substrate-binding protein [Roseateles sp. SL47]WAC71560.1 BMP family ABC transporter substrate-binding protein [Roseateles sp. SL47]